MNIKAIGFVGTAFVALIVATGCSSGDDSSPGGGADTGDEQDITQRACGGLAGLQCPKGYACELGAHPIPDQTGKCKKAAPDPAPTCLTLTCQQGYHCDQKGINGGTIAACIKNDPAPSGPSCITLTCEQGYHCEQKGLNGGSIGVCVRN